MPHYIFIYPQIKRLTGAQRLILALAGAVASTGARVTVLTHRFAPECRPALPANVGLIETGRNLNLTGNHYADSLIEYTAVPFLLGHLPVDTAAVCFFGPPSLPGLWWARHVRRLKYPLLYFCYEPPRAAYTDRVEVSRRMGKLGGLARPLFWLYRPLDRYLTGQAAAILVNGRYGQQLIQETYGKPSTIITHGAELNLPPDLQAQATEVRRRYKLGERPTLITVNHLHPRKRVDLLLEALPAVLEQHPSAVALIVGQGPEAENLRELAARLGLGEEQVKFTGFVADEELAAYYAAADLYVHTGRAETFGLSVLEAARTGLPVVAVNEGGPTEILLNGQTGFLVEAVPTALTEKINWLLSHPTEARQMGQAGSERTAQRYTWERGAQDFLGVVERVKQV